VALPPSVIDEERAAGMPPTRIKNEYLVSFDAAQAGAAYGDLLEQLAETDGIATFCQGLALTDRAWFGETDRDLGVIGVGELSVVAWRAWFGQTDRVGRRGALRCRRLLAAGGRRVPVGVALDHEYVRVVEQPVHRRTREERVAEHRRPLLDGAVRGDGRRPVLVPAPHDLIEVRRLVLREAAESQVVYDEHVRRREAEQALLVAPVSGAARSWTRSSCAPTYATVWPAGRRGARAPGRGGSFRRPETEGGEPGNERSVLLNAFLRERDRPPHRTGVRQREDGTREDRPRRSER
jgi:hypothetical protein